MLNWILHFSAWMYILFTAACWVSFWGWKMMPPEHRQTFRDLNPPGSAAWKMIDGVDTGKSHRNLNIQTFVAILCIIFLFQK